MDGGESLSLSLSLTHAQGLVEVRIGQEREGNNRRA